MDQAIAGPVNRDVLDKRRSLRNASGNLLDIHRPTPSVPLMIPRKGRPDTEMQAKEVKLGDRRYIVCRNLVEAAQAARTREAVLATLRAKLRQGDKSLVGNSAYRRYLKTPDQQHFTIDEARVAEDARPEPRDSS